MPKPVRASRDGDRVELHCPVSMPQAGSFLWNPRMLLQVNCRGFVVARHMQPEVSRYSRAPVLELPTFMLPESPLYAHHPGRFVYVRDDDSGELFSLPYEPVRRRPQSFVFSAGSGDIEWRIGQAGIESRLRVAVPADDVVELWSLEVANAGDTNRQLTICPCFTIGYMSWMHQWARYRDDLGGIVACSVTPYQKLEDYERIRTLKDLTFFLHDTVPDAWEASRDAFEGEGGIAAPDALFEATLGNGDALYETPVAALQYRLDLAPGVTRRMRFLFGPARDDAGIRAIRERYLAKGGYARSDAAYRDFLGLGRGCLAVTTPDADFDRFVNHWLGRQVWYHGSANRLTTDPQTRNYLQDAMGMVYVNPQATRHALRLALARQLGDGNLPDGIKLLDDTELKYINQVPHTDHCVWLPICVAAYLDETADTGALDEVIAGDSLAGRVTRAMRWLIANRDARGLSLIAQGDWCDPMNMVGHGGKGISGWLSIASVHALRTWAGVCRRHGLDPVATEMETAADAGIAAIQEHLWDGNWFARGISDDGTVFGVANEDEGRIYLNPQSWALFGGVATQDQQRLLLAAIATHLETPFGAMVLAPAYTAMREHIGRLTQKHPGVAENGSVYNHAATFYIWALLQLGDADRAWDQLRRMIPGPDEGDFRRRGQLPVFVPNYYRGAVRQFPRTAGRSSQLFNTGAASWLYRAIVEGLFGLRGSREGLVVDPRLPGCWQEATAERRFRGARYAVRYRRDASTAGVSVSVDGRACTDNVVPAAAPGADVAVDVMLPAVT